MNQSFQRARSPEHKELRRRMILDAAARVLDRDGFNETSLNSIAQEAGVVKSGLYRYFESREEILIELMLSDMQDMCDAFAQDVTEQLDVDRLAQITADCFVDRPRLCLLISRMASTLEYNITCETIRGFKRKMNECTDSVAASMNRAIPHWSLDDCHNALRMQYVLVSGLFPMTCPPAHVKRVLDEPEFCSMSQEFEPAVRYATQAMFRGVDSIAMQRHSGV
ncbi:transcriptional regulator, TetR family [Monaibacterium marinum]|uniref:Transcriptional regulator, TetR family n=2 Tax=Pontivivens marinum TaxID=1690039 RepID=A0A2C9CTL6_9RHOB|nr:transcriptional regulator, TetR family [Monaibacterium marinum]